MTRVFVNGVWDLCHCSHIRLLQFCKRLCTDRDEDTLIVAMNSDESVRSIKGPSRPIIPEEQRMEMLYALGADTVIIYDDKTPLRIVQMERPDILVVSREHGDQCESSKHVRSYGGRVVIADDCGDVRTSDIIERCKRA
jgi:rfaE bifunctional protein nucleotidyltransferase chain/domain